MSPEETGPLREEEQSASARLVGVETVEFLDKGIPSLKAHKAYIENLSGDFDPEAFLRNNASATGDRFGCLYAVGFEVMKI
jgi:hypothetical protein